MLLKITLRAFRQLAPMNLYRYSTAPPPPGNTPVFKFPRRWELKTAAFDELFDVIGGLTQYKQFANVLKVIINPFRIISSFSQTSIWVSFTKHSNI